MELKSPNGGGRLASGRIVAEGPPAALAESTPLTFESRLTCPACGHAKCETMPANACQWFYECERCRTLLKPKAGDCCVFCSYGSVPCPPVQVEGHRPCCRA